MLPTIQRERNMIKQASLAVMVGLLSACGGGSEEWTDVAECSYAAQASLQKSFDKNGRGSTIQLIPLSDQSVTADKIIMHFADIVTTKSGYELYHEDGYTFSCRFDRANEMVYTKVLDNGSL